MLLTQRFRLTETMLALGKMSAKGARAFCMQMQPFVKTICSGVTVLNRPIRIRVTTETRATVQAD